jgi:hypothetical protein
MDFDEMLLNLYKYGDVETATCIWSEANEAEKKAAEVKKACMSLVERHLRETGEKKGKTSVAVYGWTSPKPKLQLNERKWNMALESNTDLYAIVSSYEFAKLKLDNAQKEYIEEIEGTPRVYIK